ncbi:DNA primase [Variovorax paradoxus]|jgi:DNA primase|uniref:DNA primase n=1 Tax=Variovorax paradoxus TaxID=34073 RepID=UPI0006E58165|nr:DNA primase [Variovorax paradoxus]KPU96587.1 DNA primase [Variovorax paradoxus]KPV01515.1 DNA primase [Variovorax paradoxus]KPV15752.1 DNA primase [Variovorax paradoxus]KPV35457.1 DNA primase [Variovorax paradoxus]
MTIPASFIQELIARADVVEIVGRYVQLKKAGANFMGLCPFHGEKSPSFSVSPTKQFYHCFGCGAHGNAIGFLMEHAGMGFVEAVHDLAGQYGLQVPEDDASPAERARAASQRQKQATLTDVLEKAGDAFRKHLRQAPGAIDYLKGRGVSGEIAKQFGIGYAPPGWRTLAGVFPDYEDPLLAESGLVIVNTEDGQVEASEAKRYDRFRDRVMFPIRNVKGECIGFGGRVLGDEKPKYLNSPETPVFSKGRELYGLYEARAAFRDRGYALVTEGYMDVVALAQLGFPNAVATLGTACTTEHVQKLFRFTESVVFSFDGDAAGRRAARKALDGALPYATDTRSIKFLFLPAEHDPDSFIREFGADAFARFVQEATPLSRFMIEAAREGCDLGTAEGRAHMSSNVRPLWSALPDGALKRQLLSEIATLVQLDAAALSDLWATAAAPRGGGASRQAERSQERPPDDDGYFPEPPIYEERERHYENDSKKRPFNKRFGRKEPPREPMRGRSQPLSRPDIAVRLLLANMGQWEPLSHEVHLMLCELPGPHGALFTWLDSQLHEHGAQSWAALREGLRGQEFEALADKLMTAAEGGPPVDPEASESDLQAEAARELGSVLDFMLDDRLKFQQSEAIAAVGKDPRALERYKALEARRLELRARMRPKTV